MKTFILPLLMTLLMVDAIAQTYPLRDRLDQVFANINKTQIPTGFLEEYGVALARLAPYNGVLSDSNKLDIATWRKVYATFYTTRINGSNPVNTLGTVNTTIENTEANFASILPIPILYADYNSIRTDAITANLLSASNNQLYDVPGRTQSPYVNRKLFIAAPSTGYARSGSPQVLFKPELFYNYSGKTLNFINVDFGDGRGYLNALWNTPLAGAYTSTGLKQIKIKAVFTDNTFVECYSAIEVVELGTAQARFGNTADATQPFTANANHAGGTAFIKYSSTNNARKIRKPLIVAEGYDISSIAPKLQTNFSFKNFIDELFFSSPYELNGQLDLAGYDIIFLDYSNGTDDIRRNAALLQEVVVWVNGQKAAAGSTELNVVFGISMGGLVARYALANMTKQGIATQTRQLITHDSPHRGANTPLGLQALTRGMYEVALVQGLNIYDLVPELRQANRVLDAPATAQLLLYRAGFLGTYLPNSFLDNEYRTMITFAATGPQPSYQIKATSLGSECGVVSLVPSTELLRISGQFFISPLFFISRTSWNTEIIVNALPDFGSSQRVMKLRLWINIRILFFISIDLNLTNKEAYSPPNSLAWDGAPGGTQSVSSQAGSRVPSVDISFGPFFNLSFGATFAGDFCFVPAVSALDVTNLDPPALQKAYTGGISPTNPARVNNFIAQERIAGTNVYNQAHPRLTPRNAQWVFNEIQNISNTLNCASSCTIDYGASVTGGGLVCTSTVFSISNNIYSLPVTWSSSNPSGLSINPTTGVATRVNNYNGPATITATINGGCGGVNLQRNVWVGNPPADNSTLIWTGVRGTNPVTLNTGSTNQYQCDFVPYADSYTWVLPRGFRAIGSTTTSSPFISITTTSQVGTYTLLCRANNGACFSWTSSLTINVVSSGGGGQQMRAAFPNPANDSFTVKVKEEDSKEVAEVALFNKSMERVYYVKTEEKEVIVSTTNLLPGVYYLNVVLGKEVTQKQVVINH